MELAQDGGAGGGRKLRFKNVGWPQRVQGQGSQGKRREGRWAG